MKKLKAQEEIVGFALIVLLIVIIGLVFLSLSLRKKPLEQENKQVANLIDAMLQYTSKCAIYMPEYLSMRDLIKSCYLNEQCIDDKSACQHLQETAEILLNAAEGDLSAENPVKAYEFNVSYSAQQTGFILRKPEASILYKKRGVCGMSSIAAQQFLALDSGNIQVALRFCY